VKVGEDLVRRYTPSLGCTLIFVATITIQRSNAVVLHVGNNAPLEVQILRLAAALKQT
jgi:hypothetical protein